MRKCLLGATARHARASRGAHKRLPSEATEHGALSDVTHPVLRAKLSQKKVKPSHGLTVALVMLRGCPLPK